MASLIINNLHLESRTPKHVTIKMGEGEGVSGALDPYDMPTVRQHWIPDHLCVPNSPRSLCHFVPTTYAFNMAVSSVLHLLAWAGCLQWDMEAADDS